MKSSEKELASRGFVMESDSEKLSICDDESLEKLLHDKEAVTRTKAAGAMDACNERHVKLLLEQLRVEKCLYTRIAICETLEKGNKATAKQMVKYLGKIGKNQHQVLPESVSKKKSYPLPRDIIARTLGKMNPEILPILMDTLNADNEEVSYAVRRELLDAIGFLVFYHQELVTEEIGNSVINTLKRYSDDEITVWKVMMCLSAIPFVEVIKVLESYVGRGDIIGLEAARSLRLMKKA